MDVSFAELKLQTVPPIPRVAGSELVAAGCTDPPDGQPFKACAVPPAPGTTFQYDGESNDKPPGWPVKSWFCVELRSASVEPLSL
jgi:hypothetical protein